MTELTRFETASAWMEPMWRVDVQIPSDEVDEVMNRLTDVVPLTMGFYDRCAFQSAPGVERYRPRDGAAAGSEERTRKRPGIVEVSFQIPRDRATLTRVVETIVESHSYQEPVITVSDSLASRAKSGDDQNPNRWWNKGGDWMKQP